MKFNLYIILLSCTILLGCTLSGSQRYQEISAQEASTVAVLCAYQRLCESNEYGNFKEGVEVSFASKGFRVIPFKALDQELDYLIVVDMDNKYNGDYMKAALVDYRSREIAGRMSYVPLSGITKVAIDGLVEEMLKSPIVEPDFDVKLK